MLYQITATVEHCKNGWWSQMQIPTFLLDSDIQGIKSKEGAEAIAKVILNPSNDKNIKVECTVDTVALGMLAR